MKYTPEKYEWENGDIIAKSGTIHGSQVCMRIGPDQWIFTQNKSTITNGNGNTNVMGTDYEATTLIKQNVYWKYVGNYHKVR